MMTACYFLSEDDEVVEVDEAGADVVLGVDEADELSPDDEVLAAGLASPVFFFAPLEE